MSAKSTVKIDGYSEGHLLRTAAAIIDKKAKATKIFDSEADERIPKFDPTGKNNCCSWDGTLNEQLFILLIPRA